MTAFLKFYQPSGLWNDKVVIITGSSAGIGKTLAFEIASKGGLVVLNARSADRLLETESELRREGWKVVSCAGDVSNARDCSRLIETAISAYGRIDILINNAGLASKGCVEDIEISVFKRIIEVNLIGAFNMTHLALPHLKNSSGSVFFIGSLAGIHGLGCFSAYCSSKMALTAFAESLRQEVHKTKVHVGIAYLGFVENASDKMMLGKNGKQVAMPADLRVKRMSQKSAVGKIMQMIERRKFKRVFSPLGKLLNIVNRISPGLTHHLQLAIRKDQEG